MTNPSEINYATAVKRIEEIVECLRDPKVDIDHMLAQVEEAAVLIELCRAKLASTGLKIDQVLTSIDLK